MAVFPVFAAASCADSHTIRRLEDDNGSIKEDSPLAAALVRHGEKHAMDGKEKNPMKRFTLLLMGLIVAQAMLGGCHSTGGCPGGNCSLGNGPAGQSSSYPTAVGSYVPGPGGSGT